MLVAIRGGWQALWLRRHSPEVWLLASNLLSRFLGFWVSLLVSRQLGVQALGLYSGILITTASPTTPTSAVLANNATMMATRAGQAGRLWPILLAQRVVLLLCLLVSCAGAYVMLQMSGLHGSELLPAYVVWMAGLGLIGGQLLTQCVLGAFHGADQTLPASRTVSAVTVVAILSAWPVVWAWGMSGLLVQAMLVALVPGGWLAFKAWRLSGGGVGVEPVADLQREASSLLWKALPSVGATVLNNATNWLACIYLVERHHGRVGLGLVALGLQWMAVMLLPLSSWSARIMRALTLAHQGGAQQFWPEVQRQVRKCFLISAAASALVLAAVVPIGLLYKVAVSDIWGIFLINALACALSSVSFVYERVFYCVGQQRPWLWMSFFAYAGQLLVTYLVIPHSVLAVPLGNLFAIVVLIGASWWYWRQDRMRGA
jgi:O-antigen/teichoic acid export membrane protein